MRLNETPEIAGRLTAAQRDAVSGAYEFEGELCHDGSDSTGRSLLALELVGHTGRLTPLGLALRAHLASQVPA